MIFSPRNLYLYFYYNASTVVCNATPTLLGESKFTSRLVTLAWDAYGDIVPLRPRARIHLVHEFVVIRFSKFTV